MRGPTNSNCERRSAMVGASVRTCSIDSTIELEIPCLASGVRDDVRCSPCIFLEPGFALAQDAVESSARHHPAGECS